MPTEFDIFLTILYVLLLVYLAAYYYKLEYFLVEKTICIKSGIILRRERIIPLNEILWTTRLFMPFCRTSAVSILHTARGSVVIFGEFSTPC